ncbi:MULTISPECIES: DegV family protein [unclassified Moraxella]|uniref:DegV family protein n=1 Tax=unclassified Moraxella TaxID=2685852 RepID=UPI003AF616B8
MKRIIVSTSTSCLDYLDKPANVITLPMNIHLNGNHYLDGKTITNNELATYLVTHPNSYPETSAPSESQLIDFFYELVKQGYEEVLILSLSSRLSETYQNIKEIRAMFASKLNIHLYDTRSVSHGEAVLVYEASKMLRNPDVSVPQIILRLNQIRAKSTYFITVDNLKGMIRTKRISAPAGFFANLLNIKPIVICGDEGQFVAYEKVRSFDKSLSRLAEIVASEMQGKSGKLYLLSYEKNPHLPQLSQMLGAMGLYNVPVMPIASVSLANIGVYAMGLLFVED